MWASGDWLDFCGWKNDEVVGKTLKSIESHLTETDVIVALNALIDIPDITSLRLTNTTRKGSALDEMDTSLTLT